jgi:hypothetical protein
MNPKQVLVALLFYSTQQAMPTDGPHARAVDG